ncbi:MAG: prephenate dehydrogenase/arogenate dehydrogenase family protein [Acidimicrobiia bacterium]|jgi:prephenate dehydrogenase
MSTRRAAIFGTGLIGASVGLALRSQGWSVRGWDPSPEALEVALERGAVESALDEPDPATSHLVVLASPPRAVMETLETMDTDALVTDVASVKAPIVAAARRLAHFVGGHPMAGGETSGASLSSSSMFHGATWVLSSDHADQPDLETMISIVSSFGANPVVMTAREHDAAVARVSHLPHVLAAALMGLADQDPATLGLAGGGFRDLTRIAAADSTWWAEVLNANADQVRASIDELQQSLESWKRLVAGDGAELGPTLESARRSRLGLGEHHTQVRVILLDRPGEIARVGHALEMSRVDVRDFQLRHGEHGGGGVLTISVKGEGKDSLTMALVDEGFEVKVDI